MARSHGTAFDFHAKSYVLPQDRDLLDRDFEELGKDAVFIKKPQSGAQGIGISLVTRSDEVQRDKRLLVQRYIGEPHLIGKKKYDLRIYVVVTSWDPLRVYVYDEGLVRFATKDYKPIKSAGPNKKIKGKDRYMHLTNYSLNKDADEFEENDDIESTEGHKWALSALWKHMDRELGIDVNLVKQTINDIVNKTLISADHIIAGKLNSLRIPKGVCYEVFGFDILLDAKLKPWLIEVNALIP
jgi:tubulin polyglutamylase TTLL4